MRDEWPLDGSVTQAWDSGRCGGPARWRPWRVSVCVCVCRRIQVTWCCDVRMDRQLHADTLTHPYTPLHTLIHPHTPVAHFLGSVGQCRWDGHSGLIRGRGMGAGSDGGDTGPAAAAVGNVAGVITLNQVFRPRTTLWGGGH